MYQIYQKMQAESMWISRSLALSLCIVAALAICVITTPASLAAPVPTKKVQAVEKKTPTKTKVKPKTSKPREMVIPERTAYIPTPKTSAQTPTQPQPKGGDTNNPLSPAQAASGVSSPKTSIPEPKITTGPYIRYAPELAKPELELRAKAATVNIVCSVTLRGVTYSSLGSGVVVSPDGVLLTNAHVGIYSLFPEAPARIRYIQDPGQYAKVTEPNCIARGNSPAEYLYDLEAVYVPSVWVAEYGSKLFNENLSGTGAGDYMLLRRKIYADPRLVRGESTSSKLAPLPFLPIDTALGSLERGDSVLGSGYPAEFLGSELIISNLTYAASYITVGEGFTFGDNMPDTFSLGGSIIARAGISGGPAVDSWGKVVGIMSTATRAKTTAERTLRTISLEYINRDITSTTSIPLEKFIARDDVALEKSTTTLTYAKNLLRGLYPM